MAKTYPAPWQGRLLLACKKCQKRLKKDGGPKALSNLKKALKPSDTHDLNMGCVDLCPKKGIVVCLPAEAEDRLQILWSEEDLKFLSSPKRLKSMGGGV